MSFLISKIAGFVTSPLVWIILSMIVTFVLWIRRANATKAWLIITIVLSVVMTNPLLANTIFHYWEKAHTTPAVSDTTRYDYAIVLSGMVSEDPAHNQLNFGESSDRILEAAKLFHAKKVCKIIVTGGNASIYYQQSPEAKLLTEFLNSIGVPDSCIVSENKARNTYENALFTAQLPEISQNTAAQNLLITSAYHMPRAAACFRNQGINFTPHPVDYYVSDIKTDFHSIFVPSIAALEKWNILLHEWLGWLYYKTMGYI